MGGFKIEPKLEIKPAKVKYNKPYKPKSVVHSAMVWAGPVVVWPLTRGWVNIS